MKVSRNPSDGNDEKIWEPGAALETSDGRENESRNQQVTFGIWKPELSCPGRNFVQDRSANLLVAWCDLGCCIDFSKAKLAVARSRLYIRIAHEPNRKSLSLTYLVK